MSLNQKFGFVETGKLYKVKWGPQNFYFDHDLLSRYIPKRVPLMALWIPENFGSEPLHEWNDIYLLPLLLIGIVPHGEYPKTKEHLLEFLYGEQIYWTDWFNLELFSFYFDWI